MPYRRRQGLSRSSTFKEEILRQPDQDDATTSSTGPPHRASDYRFNSFRSSSDSHSFKNRCKSSATFDRTSTSRNEPGGFWGVLARKAKSILEDDNSKQSNTSSNKKPETISFSTSSQFTGIQVHHQHKSLEKSKKMSNPTLMIGLDALMPSLNQTDVTIENALETEKKTQDIIQETHDLQNRRRTCDNQEKNLETQLQASRDVALATVAKVKQLVRELKTVTTELASTNTRCCQLEEENKLLQASREQRDHPADDMIRVQLETLLVEKGCLAHANSEFVRENRFLRELVEFHQLKMKDMVYLDEEIKESFQEPMEELDTLTRFD